MILWLRVKLAEAVGLAVVLGGLVVLATRLGF
jgi:hypothetical protein